MTEPVRPLKDAEMKLIADTSPTLSERYWLATVAALRAKVWDLEGDQASVCDLLNSALRDTGLGTIQVEPERMKPGIEELWFKLNRHREMVAALQAEVERAGDAARDRYLDELEEAARK